LIDQCHNCEANLKQFEKTTRARKAPTFSGPFASATAPSAFQPSFLANPAVSNAFGDAMDLSVINLNGRVGANLGTCLPSLQTKPIASWTQDEKTANNQWRKANNLCGYCGEPCILMTNGTKHIAANCPKKTQRSRPSGQFTSSNQFVNGPTQFGNSGARNFTPPMSFSNMTMLGPNPQSPLDYKERPDSSTSSTVIGYGSRPASNTPGSENSESR